MLSVHNSHMYLKLMADVRQAIAAGAFAEFYRQFIAQFTPSRKILAARTKRAAEPGGAASL
jgi:tRNA-guanine family transglycosylase